MTPKKYSQFGHFSFWTLLLALTALAVQFVLNGSLGGRFYWDVALMGFLLLLLFVFHRLTIRIDEERLTFRFGLGIFGWSYKISDLEYCRPVRNSMWYGIGVRLIPSGWLFNVSGLRSIELKFKGKSGVIRIGTDKPEEIAGIVNKLIAKSPTIKSQI